MSPAVHVIYDSQKKVSVITPPISLSPYSHSPIASIPFQPSTLPQHSHTTILYDLSLFCTEPDSNMRSLTFCLNHLHLKVIIVNFIIFVGLIYYCFQIPPFPFDEINCFKKYTGLNKLKQR